MNISRRDTLASGLGLLGACALPGLARAQANFPNGPIKFIIPTPAGGGHDTMMRLIGHKLTEAWGQPCIVESKPGASGMLAAGFTAKQPPDGLTLMVGYSAFLSNLALQANPGYKQSDFVPVAMLALTPIAIGVRETLGVDTLQAFVALAKSQPGKLSYGSYGPGSGGHFVGELLNMAAGIETIHAPYKGEAPALQDLAGQQIDAAVTSIGGVSRFPGKIKPLAVASAERFPLYPNVPTFTEAGYPAVNMPGWATLFAPAGTPPATVSTLAAEMNRIVKLPDVAPKLLELGFEPVNWSPEKLDTFLKEQLKVTQELVSSGRVKI